MMGEMVDWEVEGKTDKTNSGTRREEKGKRKKEV